MSNGIYVALSGAMAQSNALDVASNNVANANTTGYHGERIEFSQALAKAKDSAFVNGTAGKTDDTQGVITPTGNPLDAAIQGDGFFAIDTARGVRYTRDGAFRLDSKNQLVTSEGNTVRSTDGKPLKLPPEAGDVSIAADGTVSAGDTAVGKIKLARFAPQSVRREGASMYVANGPEVKGGKEPELAPAALEGANVSVVRGVVELVRISRSYEALHKMIETYKDMDDRAARSIAGNG
jgi:flagellar basal-body rod protein FlgF